MPEKPKAGGKKGKSRKKEEKPQAERFIDTARRISADETGEEFERAFTKIVPPRRRKSKH